MLRLKTITGLFILLLTLQTSYCAFIFKTRQAVKSETESSAPFIILIFIIILILLILAKSRPSNNSPSKVNPPKHHGPHKNADGTNCNVSGAHSH